MATYHFTGIKQRRRETPEQRKKRIQAQFLLNYNNYQSNKKRTTDTVLDEVKQILGI
jgi:hypothetical protein